MSSIYYFSTLLDKDDRSVRIAGGEALALIFEMGNLDKFCGEAKGSNDSSTIEGKNSQEFVHIQGLREKILNQVRNLSVEAGGKGSAKKDLNHQRNSFRDILELLEENEFLHDLFDFTPKSKLLLGTEGRISAIEKAIGEAGHAKVALDLLRCHFPISNVKRMDPALRGDGACRSTGMPVVALRLYKSPNSVLSKARTQFLNKQRTLSQDKNTGRFAVGLGEEEV
ncbi:unnamed protein product [Ilex paraguariensis]|uniref:Uncharacterized protein n=1 Tax=Ilex paraguariensis TaxID=185542 RepID=A0ABC8UPA8_9AQUA